MYRATFHRGDPSITHHLLSANMYLHPSLRAGLYGNAAAAIGRDVGSSLYSLRREQAKPGH